MTDEQELRLHRACMQYRYAQMGSVPHWRELVRVVDELMSEAAEAAQEHEQRHAWTD